MMDIIKINHEAGEILKLMSRMDLKSDEKIATLRVAADTIQHVLNCEMFTISMSNILQGQQR